MKKGLVLIIITMLLLSSFHVAAFNDSALSLDIPDTFVDQGDSVSSDGSLNHQWVSETDGSNINIVIASNIEQFSCVNVSDEELLEITSTIESGLRDSLDSIDTDFAVLVDDFISQNSMVGEYPCVKTTWKINYEVNDSIVKSGIAESYMFATNNHLISITLYYFSNDSKLLLYNSLNSLSLSEKILQPDESTVNNGSSGKESKDASAKTIAYRIGTKAIDGAIIGALIGAIVIPFAAILKRKKRNDEKESVTSEEDIP